MSQVEALTRNTETKNVIQHSNKEVLCTIECCVYECVVTISSTEDEEI